MFDDLEMAVVSEVNAQKAKRAEMKQKDIAFAAHMLEKVSFLENYGLTVTLSPDKDTVYIRDTHLDVWMNLHRGPNNCTGCEDTVMVSVRDEPMLIYITSRDWPHSLLNTLA